MKPSLYISKQNSQLLFSALRKNIVAQKHVFLHNASSIMLSVEFKLLGDYILDAQCVMSTIEWANMMSEIKPTYTVGTKSFPIDWAEMDKKQLIDEMEDCIEELIDKIEIFDLEVVDIGN